MEGEIRQAVLGALTKLGIIADSGIKPVFTVEHPADSIHGDYATNVALVAAKAAGKNPRELADQLVGVLHQQLPKYIARVEVAGPGFINFYLTRDFFADQLTHIKHAGEQWGHHDSWSGKKVLLEYTSPNLFKPLHVGNLVGNIIGESVSRLFEVAGATVKRFNYPSDIGLTVAKGVWGLLKTGNDPNDILQLGEAYKIGNAAYENDNAAKVAIDELNRTLYEGSDEVANDLRERGIATSKASLTVLLRKLGTTFDHEITESAASDPGANIIRENIGAVFIESQGAVVYPGEKVGLHTRVFLNSKGLPTYEAKDVGHFKLKHATEPDWDVSIIVTGNEQSEYFKVVFAAIAELFPEAADRTLEHIPTGFLTLTTGKMSSRTGNVLTGESLFADMEMAAREKAAETRTDNLVELSEQVAVAALKYQILKHGIGQNIVFDKERALSFEGDSGPYLQYTHARICSVIEKAAEAGIKAKTAAAPAEPYAVERLVYQFPEVTEAALRERAPHKVTTYLTELAGAFNTFYGQEKIADPADQFAPYKLALSQAVGATLKNGLWTLGIKAPERM